MENMSILTKGLQTSITDTSSYLYYRTPHYQSPETIARQHYTDTWVEQIQSYPIDGVDVKSLAWTGEAIYDEKKSKNNHNDCDLDFGDYTDLYKNHSLCDNRTSIETMQDSISIPSYSRH